MDILCHKWNNGPVLDLNDLRFFVRVVDHGGLSAAGRALGLPKSTLSRRLQALERRLGVRLVQRSTRRFTVTDVGQEVFDRAKAMLVEAEAAEGAAQRRLAEPSGTLRLTCSAGMAQDVMPELLPRFMRQHPKVDLILLATNRHVDLVEEGLDVGLRGHVGPLPDTGLVQRPVSAVPWVLVAAPSYLEARGVPSEPAELAAHDGLLLGGAATRAAWTLHCGERVAEVQFSPRLRSNDTGTLLGAAAAGLGIVAAPGYMCREHLADGTLKRVLPQWSFGDHRVTLLVPSRRGQLPAVRALIDFLVVEFPRLTSTSLPRG